MQCTYVGQLAYPNYPEAVWSVLLWSMLGWFTSAAAVTLMAASKGTYLHTTLLSALHMSLELM